MEKLVLIDGSSYFFRAYYAIQHLSTSTGTPTNAVYGFINMILKVLEVDKPKHLAICFDTAKPSFRKELYDKYKANRTEAPDDLVIQIPLIQRAVDCFKISRLEKEGYEADDVIATITEQATAKGYAVDIISGDKDLMQLVGPKVALFDTMNDKRYDAKAVFEKFNVKPDQMRDFLALMGDSSDNIPGVKGIGKKTAAELLDQFGTLEKLYQNLDKIKQQKRRETLETEKEMAFLSRDLVTLKTDVPVSLNWKDLEYTGPNREALQDFFIEFEFQNLLKRFGMKIEEKKEKLKACYETIDSQKKLDSVLKGISSQKTVAVDTETTSLSVHSAKLVGISLSAAPGIAYYLPIAHKESTPFEESTLREKLKDFLENEKLPKVGQNLKYDMQILRRWGVELKGIVSDTLVASYLIESDQPHNLDNLAFRHLGHQNTTYQEVTGKGKDQVLFDEVPIEKATHYAAEDADITLRLHDLFLPKLKNEKLLDLYQKVEIPLIEVLADMEYEGVCVDRKKLEAIGEDLSKELEKREKKIHSLAGESFNIHSPKQLAHILFEKLKLPTLRKTKTGYSTDEGVLSQLSASHEIADQLIKFRELAKLKSTYADGLLAQIHPQTKKIHTHFNQTVTATGRLSSSEPNLQNIPITGEAKHDIRSVFVASEGAELLSADYSQIELRLLAHFSEDRELLRAFEKDEDVHSHTAKLIFGAKSVSAEQRRIAKTINFGVVYGQTPYGLSQQLKISPGEAKAFIEDYFERYAGVKSYLAKALEKATKQGFVTTLLGRKRILPELHSQNRFRREMAERAALNTPLQGTAADLIKLAMVAIFHRLKKEQLRSKMILQVHDELVLDVPADEKRRVSSLVQEEMEGALSFKVPLKVSVGWGKSWSDCVH